MPRALFFSTFLLLTCGYALWRGRKYERLSALTCILATVSSVIGHLLMRRYYPVDYSVIEVSDLLVDTSVLAVFLVIALRSDRFWPLWVAALQLAISVSHVLKAIEPSLLPIAYGAAERFWSYPTLLVIMIGAWRQHQRVLAAQSATVRA